MGAIAIFTKFAPLRSKSKFGRKLEKKKEKLDYLQSFGNIRHMGASFSKYLRPLKLRVGKTTAFNASVKFVSVVRGFILLFLPHTLNSYLYDVV